MSPPTAELGGPGTPEQQQYCPCSLVSMCCLFPACDQTSCKYILLCSPNKQQPGGKPGLWQNGGEPPYRHCATLPH